MQGLEFPSVTQDTGLDIAPAVDPLLSIVCDGVICDMLTCMLICPVRLYSLKPLDIAEESTGILFCWIKPAN